MAVLRPGVSRGLRVLVVWVYGNWGAKTRASTLWTMGIYYTHAASGKAEKKLTIRYVAPALR